MSGTDLAARLRSYKDRHGLTEVELAKRLETSQPTAHRLLKGQGMRRNAVRLKAEELVGANVALPGDQWLSAVARAANRSGEFRMFVDAALRLVNSNE